MQQVLLPRCKETLGYALAEGDIRRGVTYCTERSRDPKICTGSLKSKGAGGARYCICLQHLRPSTLLSCYHRKAVHVVVRILPCGVYI